MGDIRRGGYVLSESADGRAAQVVLIGTGSETSLSVQAQKILASEGIAVRVVSMPSTSVLGWQAPIWQDAVLPHGCRAVAIEATHPDFWRKYVGRQGAVVGLSVGADRKLSHF
jgi:transketolase